MAAQGSASVHIRINLLSGNHTDIQVVPDMSVERLRVTAENAFEIEGGIPPGHQLIFPLLVRTLPLDLDLTSTVVEAGLRDADILAIIQKPRTVWNSGEVRWNVKLRSDGVLEIPEPSGTRFLMKVKDIVLNVSCHAALFEDGSVKTWGCPFQGGDSEDVQHLLHNVKSLAASDMAFAALRDDGRVICWGDPDDLCGHDREDLVEVTHIAGCSQGFAALTAHGRVITWGTPDIDVRNDADKQLELHSIKEVMGLRTEAAFAALRADDVVIAWGVFGGFLLRGVRQLVASEQTFAALLHDGSVQVWGHEDYGGDSSAVRHELQKVLQIAASFAAFAALKENGTVVSWGSPQAGGDQGDAMDRLVHVQEVTTNSTSFGSGFVATLVNGEQVCWPPDGLASQQTPEESFKQP
ncbi:unnamed protein product [Symbiodinium sp. CCMP2592]|nr:unnamed protein product [Symbiodinium sp. CCMP2592]